MLKPGLKVRVPTSQRYSKLCKSATTAFFPGVKAGRHRAKAIGCHVALREPRGKRQGSRALRDAGATAPVPFAFQASPLTDQPAR